MAAPRVLLRTATRKPPAAVYPEGSCGKPLKGVVGLLDQAKP